jgi:hypothetical protein
MTRTRLGAVATALVLTLAIIASSLMALAPDDSKNVDLVYGAF